MESPPLVNPVANMTISRLNLLRLALVHAVPLGALYTGVRVQDLVLFFGLYLLQMFAVTAGYHRYFSHRSYKTGRLMQFLLAFFAQTTGQKSVLWWAAHHRHHHRFSDQPGDVHSPKDGFWWAHMGWILTPDTEATRFERIRDLTKYPELVWLHRFQYTPAVVLGGACLAIGGVSAWIVGFFWSLIAVYHVTFSINSFTHVFGSRRYETEDTSRNNWVMAILTLGEGWHNNHHHYPISCKQGHRWWELDLTWYVLKGMEKLGLVWDLKTPPARMLAPETS